MKGSNYTCLPDLTKTVTSKIKSVCLRVKDRIKTIKNFDVQFWKFFKNKVIAESFTLPSG